MWEKQDSRFLEGSAADKIVRALECKSYVIVTGNMSSGKTALVRHVALKFKKNKKINIIPCSSFEDVFLHYKESSLQLCILEDIFGKFAIQMENVRQFAEKESKLYYMLKKGSMKLLATCRTEICNECNNHISSKLFKYHVRDLYTVYSTANKEVIASIYFNKNDFGYLKGLFQQNDYCSEKMSIYKTFDITKFLESVYDMFCKEWDSLKSQDPYKYCMLLMCVIYNSTINWKYFENADEIDIQTKRKLQKMFRWCNITSFESSLKTIRQKMDFTLDVYVRKIETQNCTIHSNVIYSVIHSEMFNFLCRYFGEKMIVPILQYADTRVIIERCFLESIKENSSKFHIKVSRQYELEYFKRVETECKDVANIIEMLKSPQMNFIEFRSKFCSNILFNLDNKTIKEVMMMEVPGANCNVFTFSCNHGYNSFVSYFANRGMDVNNVDENDTPLTAACENGYIDIAKMLIAKGADVNKNHVSGKFPLYAACNKDDFDIVRMLLDRKAQVNTIYKTLSTSLYYVCLRGQVEIAKMLIDYNADIDLTGECTETPVYAASANGHDKIVSLLLDNGADIYEMSTEQLTPLTVALQNQHSKVVETLINKDTISMLLYNECKIGCYNTVRILLDKGASINQSNQSKTPLFAACKSGNLSLVQLLLEREANIKSDTIQTSPLYAACMKDHYNIVQTLVDNGADMELVFNIMCKRGSEKCVELLIQKGADINKIQKFGQAPLHAACAMGQLSMVKLLVNKDANLNLKDSSGRTPLSLSRRDSIIEFLMAKGAQ